MPIPVPDALAAAASQAVAKQQQSRRPARYLVSSALAGAYVGVAVIVLISVTAPLATGDSPFATLVSGAVFGIALTLVVFAGAELFTGNVMTMLFGVLDGRTSWRQLASVCALSLLGNLIGSVLFGYLVHAGATLTRNDPTAGFIGAMVDGKIAASGVELLARAVLCNMLVCLALWMAMRAVGDGARLAVLWWPLLAFIVAGFEHCIANMTIFTLGVATGDAGWLDLARNLLWTVPGNIIGGAVIIGGAYWFTGRATPEQAVIESEATLPDKLGEGHPAPSGALPHETIPAGTQRTPLGSPES